MNDFLQNLRAAQADKQRAGKKRKNYDNGFNYAAHSRQSRFQSYGPHQYSKNPAVPQRQHSPEGNYQALPEDQALTLLAEAVDNIATLVDTLTKNQDFLIGAQERANEVLERQAIAMEEIVQFLFISSEKPGGNKAVMVGNESGEQDVSGGFPQEDPGETGILKETAQGTKVLKKKEGQKSGSVVVKVPENDILGRDAVMEIIYTMRGNGATYDEVARHLVKIGQPTFSGRGEWHAQTIHRLCNRRKS